MCLSRVARHKTIIKSSSSNTKLQKANNMYNGTWPITTTNKGENETNRKRKADKDEGDEAVAVAVAAAWPVACSLCLRLYCCSTRCRSLYNTQRYQQTKC